MLDGQNCCEALDLAQWRGEAGVLAGGVVDRLWWVRVGVWAKGGESELECVESREGGENEYITTHHTI